jgi:hypothetical protein
MSVPLTRPLHVAAGRERVVLELSSKAMAPFDTETAAATFRTLFSQWRSVLETAERCSVLFWTADGSELLDWRNDLDETFEWASSIGGSNAAASPYARDMGDDWHAQPFLPSTPALSYRSLRDLVATCKAVAREFGLELTVGATFDPGPEFAESSFKYLRHPEILARSREISLGSEINMVQASARLHADDRGYAGFPHGIPEGTPFGEFLGRQSQEFLTAMGFDYLWLSNGFGFTSYSWTPFGQAFDGNAFSSSAAIGEKEALLDFWERFTAECSFPIEVRGTNFSAGMDVAGDGVPALELYERGYFTASPPNSPWGPLNDNYGLELTGYLSRIATPAGDRFPLRVYVNDPWFWQNPWRDLYGREPFDIYLPASVSRIDRDGRIRIADDLQLLAADDERGQLDEASAREVTAHLLRAREQAPDAAGPLVWLYPFREYHGPDAELSRVYFEDWFATALANLGIPFNSVVSTDDLAGALDAGVLDGVVIVASVFALAGLAPEQRRILIARSGNVLAYGSLRGAEDFSREHLGVIADETVGLSGTLTLRGPDAVGQPLEHPELLSHGRISERRVATDDRTRVLATVSVDGDDTRGRVYAASRIGDGATVAWLRGSSTFDVRRHNDGAEQSARTPAELAGLADVVSAVLGELGLDFGFPGPSEARTLSGVQTVHRNAGAFWFSGFLPDSTCRVRLRMPSGAPLLINQTAWYEDGAASYNLGKSYHAESRAFVTQSHEGTLLCRELPPFPTGSRRRLVISGLRGATVIIYVPAEHVNALRMQADAPDPRIAAAARPKELPIRWLDRARGIAAADGVTGELNIVW